MWTTEKMHLWTVQSIHHSFMSVDVAASDQIADMLLRAEEFWVQRHKDPGVALPMPDENCEDLVQDVATPVKKL